MSSSAPQPPMSPPPGRPGGFGRDLTTGSIPRQLLAFSLPMLAGSALQTAYSFVNAIWVGRLLGTVALGAVTVSFPVVFVLIPAGAGLTLATNILISQHYGARDLAAVRRVVDSSCILIAVLSLVLLAVGELAAPWLLRLMNTESAILPLAEPYMQIFLLSLPLSFGLFLTRSMLQGIGDSTTPLYYQAGSLLLNAALDPLLMFGLPGVVGGLGLNGAAWATVVSQSAALVALVVRLRRRGNLVAPSFNRRDFRWQVAAMTVRIGLPSAVQQSLIAMSMVSVTGIVNGLGVEATAAFGAAGRVDQLAFLPAMTISMAISTLTGQNIGAGRYDRIRSILRWGCLLSGGITLACSLLAVSLPRTLVRIFDSNPGVVELGSQYLRIVGACYLFFGIMFVSNGIINGAGRTVVTTAITLVSLWAVRVPAALLLSRWWGASGVWVAIGGSFGVSMLASLAYYAGGRWRKPLLRPAPPSTPNQS